MPHLINWRLLYLADCSLLPMQSSEPTHAPASRLLENFQSSKARFEWDKKQTWYPNLEQAN